MNVTEIISSGVLELYASGLASAEEVQQVQQWVKDYPEVKAELEAIEMTLENYAKASAVAPGESVKAKLMASINATAEEKPAIVPPAMETNKPTAAPVVRMTNYWKWAAAAAIVLLVLSSIFNVNFYKQYQTAQNELQQKKDELAQAEKKNTDIRSDMEVVSNKYSVPVVLNGQQTLPDAKAKIFWMTNTGDVMIDASNLPDAPAGQQYQFWGIVDGQPVDGGLIITTDKGKKYRLQKMKAFGRAEAFAISLEKEGGNATPTKVVSMGAVCKI